MNSVYFKSNFFFAELIKLCWKFLSVEENQLWLWEGRGDNLVRIKPSMSVDL